MVGNIPPNSYSDSRNYVDTRASKEFNNLNRFQQNRIAGSFGRVNNQNFLISPEITIEAEAQDLAEINAMKAEISKASELDPQLTPLLAPMVATLDKRIEFINRRRELRAEATEKHNIDVIEGSYRGVGNLSKAWS